jgi:hypothetical protein
MGSFQKTVLIIALIILIIALLFIGISIKQANKQQWPPIIGDCPDYWMDVSGNGTQCVNVKDLGTCQPATTGTKHTTMDFTTSAFTGSNGLCSKYTWANKCGVSWDGITYGVANPCNV